MKINCLVIEPQWGDNLDEVKLFAIQKCIEFRTSVSFMFNGYEYIFGVNDILNGIGSTMTVRRVNDEV